MPSPHLVDALDQIEPAPYRGEAFRHVSADRHPLSGAGARSLGGRWNPPDSFATVYLGDSEETAEREFLRFVARSNLRPGDFLPRRLYRLEVTLCAVVDLTQPELPEALAKIDFGSDDLGPTQAIGEAAQYLGHEAILAPSAAGAGTVLALFNDRLQRGSSVDPLDWRLWESPPAS
jgi:RES domain-containing protein